jgi:hypothetical protein
MYQAIENKIGLVVTAVVIWGLAIYALYSFAVNFLPWLILNAVVIDAIGFYFWQRSTRRESHPCD